MTNHKLSPVQARLPEDAGDATLEAKWVSSDSSGSILKLAKYDFIHGLRRAEAWTSIAKSELDGVYRRTVFGAAWNMLIFGGFCMVIISLFGSLQPDTGYDFGPYVIIGFLIFSLLSGLIIEATGVFTTNQAWIKAVKLPLGFYIFKGIYKNLIIFGFNTLAAILIIWYFYPQNLHSSQWTLVPAFLLILVIATALCVLLGPICARQRDLMHLIQTVTRFGLFVTPIMWVPGDHGFRSMIAMYNPLTHIIEIFRAPVVLGEIPYGSWIIVLIITGGVVLASFLSYGLFRRRIVYWL